MPATPGSAPEIPTAPAGPLVTETDGRRSITITSAQMLLDAVPALLGFRPEACIVILGTQPPRRTVRVTFRYPLPDPAAPDAAAFYAGHALQLLAGQGCGQAAAIGYGPDALVTPSIELLREHGIRLIELLRVEDGRYWSYTCTDPVCCPPEGTPDDVTPDPALTALVAKDLPGAPGVLADREALAALIAPSAGTAGRSMRQALRIAQARADELTGQARTAADVVTRRYPIAPAGITAMQAAITNYRQGRTGLTWHDAAWLLVALGDPWVRDDACSRLDAACQAADLQLWLDLTRSARPGYIAAPASLAYAAWQSGNGALANVALDKALADDPDHKMAAILRQIIGAGPPPEAAKPPMTPEEVTERYSAFALGKPARTGD